MSGAYYNEIDPKAAAWLRELIRQGHIAPGDVDERSIEDVLPRELAGYTQCHFFAGIGGWSYALRLAGWADDRAVWTGSCPCQPFSAAGKGLGFADERHLWPAWFHLISECRPVVVFGEQVASPAGLNWLALVHADMEESTYNVGAADLCAASVGAPHIRQRLYWVAHDDDAGRIEHTQRDGAAFAGGEEGACGNNAGGCGVVGDPRESRSGRNAGTVPGAQGEAERGLRGQLNEPEHASGVGHSEKRGERALNRQSGSSHGQQVTAGGSSISSDVGYAGRERLEGRSVSAGGRISERTAWAPSDFVWCRDGKWRPVEPGSFPLAHGIPGRVGLLRGYGNAIVPQVAAAFIEATGLV